MTSETQANSYVAGVYTYNADGQRVRRNVGGVETWQVYGLAGELLAEYAANAAPTSPQKEYGYRNGQLLVTVGTDGETPVSWTNAVRVSVSGNSLTKTGGGPSAWNAGAASEKGSIDSGDGYMEFTASGTNKARRAGLSQGDKNQSWDDIDFCIFLDANGTVSINEGATLRGSFGSYASGDRFRVSVEGGVVKYRKNGVLLYTSTVVPAYPLIVDTSLFTTGATINNVVTFTSGLRWFVTDQLGTPRMLFDQTGSLAGVSRHDYLPFGEEIFAGTGGRTTTQGYSATDGVRQKFTQKERDNETGLDFFEARYYASTQGRFTSVDPLGASAIVSNPQSFNRYTYVLNNPLKYIDPDGMDAHDPWASLTDEERKLLASKLTTVTGKDQMKAAGQAFNKLVTATNKDGTLNEDQTNSNVASVQNFVGELGGDSKVWNQIQSIDKVSSTGDGKQSDINFTVQNRSDFLGALSQTKDAYGKNRFVYLGNELGHVDSTRELGYGVTDPSMHLGRDGPGDTHFGAHWDPSTALTHITAKEVLLDMAGSPGFPIGAGRRIAAAEYHWASGATRASTQAVRNNLKDQGLVPRH
jgi:RHS repeat-associated protein